MATGGSLTQTEAADQLFDIVAKELDSDVINYGTEPSLRGLHVVARVGRIDLARKLIQQGATVNVCTGRGVTPLHMASLSGKASMVKYLILLGANVNAQSREGKTALWMGGSEGHLEVVRVLLTNGADPHVTTPDGTSPKQVAMERGHEAVHSLLDEYDTIYTLLQGDSDTEEPSEWPVRNSTTPRLHMRYNSLESPMENTEPELLPMVQIQDALDSVLGELVEDFSDRGTTAADNPPSYEDVMNKPWLYKKVTRGPDGKATYVSVDKL